MDEERTELEIAETDDNEVVENSEEEVSMSTGTAMLIGSLLTAAAFVVGGKIKKAIRKRKRKAQKEKDYVDYTDEDGDDEEIDENDE